MSKTQQIAPVHVARQAIFDRQQSVVGYELLFRADAEAETADVSDLDRASFSVILSSFLDLGLETICGQLPAFLNLTRNFFLASDPVPFPRDRVVLEILESVHIDRPLIERVRAFAQSGYRIALDDFRFRPELVPLIELADIIKIDVLGREQAEIQQQLEKLEPYGALLLAEKVETMQEFQRCEAMGFDLFQGFHLQRPTMVHGAHVPANRLAILRLLARLQDPRAEISALEKLIREDLSLSYRLLKLINSAFYGMPQRIESIRQTLVLLGMHRVRAWVSVLTLAQIDDQPHELMVQAMLRAKMCERLAEESGHPSPETAFTVGLFSFLDAMLEMPMGAVLDKLPLSDEIADALLLGEGALGRILACARDYERGDWGQVDASGFPEQAIRSSYFDAVRWAEAARREVAL